MGQRPLECPVCGEPAPCPSVLDRVRSDLKAAMPTEGYQRLLGDMRKPNARPIDCADVEELDEMHARNLIHGRKHAIERLVALRREIAAL